MFGFMKYNGIERNGIEWSENKIEGKWLYEMESIPFH
jgi:hypothetical protein